MNLIGDEIVSGAARSEGRPVHALGGLSRLNQPRALRLTFVLELRRDSDDSDVTGDPGLEISSRRPPSSDGPNLDSGLQKRSVAPQLGQRRRAFVVIVRLEDASSGSGKPSFVELHPAHALDSFIGEIVFPPSLVVDFAVVGIDRMPCGVPAAGAASIGIDRFDLILGHK